MTAGEQFSGRTLTVADAPDEVVAAKACVALRARDEADRALLFDVIFDIKRPETNPRPAPHTAKPPSDAVKAYADQRRPADGQVDADPSRQHAQSLIDRGMTLTAVAQAAHMSMAALSALLQGQFVPGRPPQRTIYHATAARLLAVEFVPPPAPTKCKGGRPFEPAGYHVGRCADCGQLAPMYHDRLNAHPRPGFEEEQ